LNPTRDYSDNLRLSFSYLLLQGKRSYMSSTTTFTVRPASLRDAKAIADLHNATVCEAFKSATPNAPVPVAALEKSQAYWREAIEYAEPQVLVALDADKIIGFVGFDRSRDKGTPPTMGEIWSIYVASSHQGEGAGLALWDAAREGLQEEGCTQVTVWIALSNDRALRFHELAGFKREPSSAKTVPVGTARVEEIRLKRTLS
jgi:ribosomal protein S18 acetylase RimI-like enzyme